MSVSSFTESVVEEAALAWLEGLGFAFGRAWNGVVYATKRVRPIFLEESEELVVVSVYTYYF